MISTVIYLKAKIEDAAIRKLVKKDASNKWLEQEKQEQRCCELPYTAAAAAAFKDLKVANAAFWKASGMAWKKKKMDYKAAKATVKKAAGRARKKKKLMTRRKQRST